MIFAKLLIYLEPINSRHSSPLEAQNLLYWKFLYDDWVIRSCIIDMASDTSPIYYYSLLNHFLRRLENAFHFRCHSLCWLSLGESEIQRREWKESFFCVYEGWSWKFPLVDGQWNSISLSLWGRIVCQAPCRIQGAGWVPALIGETCLPQLAMQGGCIKGGQGRATSGPSLLT